MVTAFIMLLETYLESASQLTLQLYVIIVSTQEEEFYTSK